MYHRLKKNLPYLFKLFKQGNYKEIWEIFMQVKLDHFPYAVKARLDKRPFLTNLKRAGSWELNFYLDLLQYRKEHKSDGIYKWEMNGKQIYANFTQFVGAHAEYLQGLFQRYYAYPWHGKRVLDVGGYIGDSALYFLESGAQKVIVYEPLQENIKALQYNLKPYQNRTEIHQKAIASQEGIISLSSNEPLGSLGFGLTAGDYCIECQGITFTSLLKRHTIDVAKIDCEGGECFLCDVPEHLIRTVPYWIIETHSPAIYTDVIHKFAECRFIKQQDLLIRDTVRLIYFQCI